jgi:hexosaminidase
MVASLALFVAVSCPQPAALKLIPTPQKVAVESGVWRFGPGASVALSGTDKDLTFAARQIGEELRQDFPGKSYLGPNKKQTIRVAIAGKDQAADAKLAELNLKVPESGNPGAYVLAVRPDTITVVGKDAAGAFYGVQTLKQLIRANATKDTIPCCTIEDWPAMRIRGWQDDVSRGPIPTMETLKRQVRTMAEFKMNAFTLYTEHVFKLEKHPTIAPPDGITADQVRELTAYAKPYHVEIIGNFQSFGHFYNILKVPGYEKLGENSWVISPAKEEAYEFLKDVYGEIAPAYESTLFNINCDEVGGLGEGASKEMVAKIGVAGVYAQHINRIADMLRAHGKTPMMWGDIALGHREIVPKLPKDLIVLSWAYHAAETWDDAIKPFTELGFRFLVCPGVSCWGQIFPDLDNAEVNISNYVRDGARYKAMGMLNTTWDDTGENLWNFNWLPLVWSAECAWKPALARDGQDWNEAREERLTTFSKAFDPTFYRAPGNDLLNLQFSLSRFRRNPVSFGMSDGAFWTSIPAIATRGFKTEDAIRLVSEAESIMRKLRDEKRARRLNGDTLDYVEFAARRAKFMGSRALVSDSIGRAQTPAEKHRAMQAIEGLAKDAGTLRAQYIELWNRENRPWWRDQMVARYDRLINELNNAASAPTFWPSSDAIGSGIDVRVETLSGAPVRYTLDGSEPTATAPRYAAPIRLTKTTRVRARAFPAGKAAGATVERTYHALTRPATISTGMSTYGDNRPESAFDGDRETFFWSGGDPGANASFTVSFASPETVRTIRVITGHRDHPEDYAHNAVLEVTRNGSDWEKVADFTKGVATANLDSGTIKGLRIRTTGPNGYWLVIREIELG